MRFNRVLCLYVGAITLIVILGAVSLHRDWVAYKNKQMALLVEHAGIASTQVDSALLDASRLLDVAKSKFSKTSYPSDKKAHELLKSTLSEFRFSASNQLFGLLFYINKDGIIRAQNQLYPAEHYDVSDRLYFVTTKEQSTPEWHVGEQVVGRTNHQRVFHYALALRDKHNVFYGLLSQQINMGATPAFNSAPETHKSESTFVFQRDGFLAFEEPYPRSPTLNDADIQAIYAATTKASTFPISGWKEISTSRTNETMRYYAGFVSSPIFGMTSIVVLPAEALWSEFLDRNAIYGLSLLIAVLGVSYLFRKLYKESLARENEHDLGLHDPLTKLLNRRAFDQEYPRLIGEAQRDGLPISILFLDIDHFHHFNDTYGHEIGDQALLAVSETIGRYVHRPLDLCCRWGGEEFVAVLPNTDECGASHIAESIRIAIKQLQIHSEGTVCNPLSASIGIVSAKVTESNRDEDFIKLADKLMYDAKSAGRDCCRSNF